MTGKAARRPGDNCAHAMKSVVIDLRGYRWEGDTPIDRPITRSVIYEMHVGGFTRHPDSGLDASRRGTYAGVIAKIPYLRSLGVTAVELLPVQQFDEQDAPPGLSNYWGYNPVVFFAPHRGYSANPDPLGAVDEFRDLVKALHRAGIEVILDVVFNHTAEGAWRANAFFARAGEPRLLPARPAQPGPVRRLQRLRQHHQRQPFHRAAHDHRLPDLLGAGHACGRLPL